MKHVKESGGESEYLDRVWSLKERIRRRDGYLRQTWDFFSRAYTKNECHLYIDTAAEMTNGEGERGGNETVAGFITVRSDGYILFLGVDPRYRGKGVGESLVHKTEESHGRVSCHTRTTNENAVGFYQHLGFEIQKRIDSYYRDGESAYYLTKKVETQKDRSLRRRISEILGESDGD
ncbi:MAG: N-acetyltransferase [Halobacteria archaeon]|nr:N-acetyltransferase [Halobacteria archaeon]